MNLFEYQILKQGGFQSNIVRQAMNITQVTRTTTPACCKWVTDSIVPEVFSLLPSRVSLAVHSLRLYYVDTDR